MAVGAVSADDASLVHAVRSSLSEEVERRPDLQIAEMGRAQYLVQVRVGRLERRATADGVAVHCELSMIVSDANGSVRFVLEGSASTTGSMDEDRLTRAVVAAAVRGALRPFPLLSDRPHV
jgi:hypothetical protein